MSDQNETGSSLRENLEILYLTLKIVAVLFFIAALYQYSTSRPQYTLYNASEIPTTVKVNQSTGKVQILSEGESYSDELEWIPLLYNQTE
jgi:hypothetical protein